MRTNIAFALLSAATFVAAAPQAVPTTQSGGASSTFLSLSSILAPSGSVTSVITDSSFPTDSASSSEVSHTPTPTLTIDSDIQSSTIITYEPDQPTSTTPPVFDCVDALAAKGTYRGKFNAACVVLVDDCLNKIVDTEFVWSKTSCVAAATCQGTVGLERLMQCKKPTFPSCVIDTPHMSYNVYANIVGDCAFAPGGCSITQQKYIDWFYGALTAIKSPVFPEASTVINDFWKPIVTWAQTGATVPYLNFDDYLHYSVSQ